MMDRSFTKTDAFQDLVQQYWPRVFAHAYRVLGNYQDAEDQTQEVFLKVYRSLSSLDNPRALAAWITRITLNTCCDALDRERRRLPAVPLAPSGQPEAVYQSNIESRLPTPEQAALRAEERRRIVGVLRRLDPLARQTLLWRDLEGRSYHEIGQLLQVKPGTVKMRIRRARLAFGRMLVDADPDLRQS